MITSKEALEQIMEKYIFYVPARSEGKEHLINCLNIIAKDLERLEKLEEEKKELKKMNEMQEININELQEHRDKVEYKNYKLKQAIEILKEFNIELTFENDTYFMDCCKSNDIELNGMDWGDRVLTKEEYLLLKEVLGNE